MLAFCLHDTQLNDQSAVVGLVQAMLALLSIFSQVWFSFHSYTTLYCTMTKQLKSATKDLLCTCRRLPATRCMQSIVAGFCNSPSPTFGSLWYAKRPYVACQIGLPKSRLVHELKECQ